MTTCSREQILDRLRGEFREMPGMRLTVEQVQRLCGIEPALCASWHSRLSSKRSSRAWDRTEPTCCSSPKLS